MVVINGFQTLVDFIYDHEDIMDDAVFKLVEYDRVIFAKFDCMYETDNGCDESDPEYEIIDAIGFTEIETDEPYEVNYYEIPEAVMCNDIVIYQD